MFAYAYAPSMFLQALKFVVIGGVFGGVATAAPVLVIVLLLIRLTSSSSSPSLSSLSLLLFSFLPLLLFLFSPYICFFYRARRESSQPHPFITPSRPPNEPSKPPPVSHTNHSLSKTITNKALEERVSGFCSMCNVKRLLLIETLFYKLIVIRGITKQQQIGIKRQFTP